MLDWAKITANTEYALTLDEQALTSYLDTVSDAKEKLHIQRLLKQERRNTGFLATCALVGVSEETLIENGTLIGPWEIVHHLGRGGMGDVYEARRADGLYEQTVALKLIQGLSPARAELFETERRRLALMNHSGIARIIDGGTSSDGRLYMAMEFVNGVPITEYVAKNKLNTKSTLKLFLGLCHAVAHAHGQLILHRDIKAQNVLVDDQATTRLIDFGIASDLDDTEQGHGAFSIATAAPEQLQGKSISVQTDVFALGVLLHELLTENSPVRQKDSGMQADKSAISNQDLYAIIEKALSLEPDARYASVSSLANDISAFLKGNPVSARKGGWIYSASKFIQRYPIANAFALIAVISLLSGLAISVKFANNAQMEAERANQALAESEVNLARAQFFLDRADTFHATQSAYADMLQSMFGAEADVDKQTRILKERWQQAYELRKDDPNNAAFLSFAIGRHFLFRNDYLTAIAILQPWVEEEYGPGGLIGFARHLLAIAYYSVGREEEALPLLRQTEKWLASSFDQASPNHIAAATQIAILTSSNTDILLAEQLLLEGLKGELADPIKIYFWNQTSKMRQMRSDFNGAYEAMKEVVNIIQDKPLMEISGTDTGLLNLANYELWHTQNLQRAEELVEKVMQTAHEVKGESRELGIAYSILANIRLLEGKTNEALQHSQKAVSIIEKYSGAESDVAILTKVRQAEMYALLKDDEANQMINRLVKESQNSQKKSKVLERVKLADIYITLQLSGLNAAKIRFSELAPNVDAIARNVELTYLMSRLKTLGVTP